MPDIKYKTTSCSPAGSFQPEDIRFGVPEEEAVSLVDGGYATYVRSTVREQAVVTAPERAVGAGQPVIPQPQPNPGRNVSKRGK